MQQYCATTLFCPFLLFPSEALWSARLTQQSRPLLLYCNNSLIVISSPWLLWDVCSCAKIYQHLWYSHWYYVYYWQYLWYNHALLHHMVLHCPQGIFPLIGPIMYMHCTCFIAGSILLHWRGHTSSFFIGSWGRRTYIKY